LEASRQRPQCGSVQVRLAMLYTTLGRFDEAMKILASPADPLCPSLAMTEVFVLSCRRDFPAAIESGKRALELHPYLQLARAFFAAALEHGGHVEEGLAHYRLAGAMWPDLPWLRAAEATCLAKLGQRAEALEILASIEQNRAVSYVEPVHLAILYHTLGKRDAAFQEMERARKENSSILSMVDVNPKFDPFRTYRQFNAWRASLFPVEHFHDLIQSA